MNAIHRNENAVQQDVSPREPISGHAASSPRTPIFQGFLAAFFNALRVRMTAAHGFEGV